MAMDRVVGQLSLADGLLRSERTIFDEVGEALDWSALRRLLGPRSGAGSGATSYPADVLLRCLLLGLWHGGLSDPALEAQMRDRLSFRRFAGLSLSDRTPDHATLWRFRQELSTDGLIDRLLEEINRQLDARGLILREGTLVDATFVQARARPPRTPRPPRASRTVEGNAARGSVKVEVQGPVLPSADPDARWGAKGGKSLFGYKIHIGADAGHTLIRRVVVSDASVPDTGPADALISGDEKAVYGDQAYYTHDRHAALGKLGVKDRLMRRPNKHHPELPARQRRRNRLIAKVRAAVERPFAMFKENFGLRRLRGFSLKANTVTCMLAACAYNLRRSAAVARKTMPA
jgi:transposase, IS5 family